jgi:hypothetical protein
MAQEIGLRRSRERGGDMLRIVATGRVFHKGRRRGANVENVGKCLPDPT